MKFNIKEKKDGDIRTITKFLLFPVKIKNEIRWLEKATIEQRYYRDMYGSYWMNLSFVDSKYKK